PASGRDSNVAKATLEELKRGDPSQPLTYAVENVVRAIDWTTVTDRTRASWRRWASAQRAPELFRLAMAVLDEIDGVAHHKVGPSRPHGLELAARLLWERAHNMKPN